ncbi:MAG TPA: protein disulfide isomerase family protein [Puia sp.]|nr:protein disulfide isomerase family protein [Puia sp.]
MKKAFLIVLVLASSHFLFAQQTPAAPATQTQTQDEAPYLKFPTIPPFHLLKLDSATYLTKDDLKKHHLTIVMFFSPTCDHCKHQTESILSNFKKFKDMEIVMATYQPFSEMREFYTEYHLAEHPNIKLGRDEKFFLAPFYKIRNLPYLALYDKKGNLITTFEGTQKVETILDAFAGKSKQETGN